VIDVIRERSPPLWQRIVSLGFAMDRPAGVDTTSAAAILEDHLRNLRNGLFNDAFAAQKGDPAFQLGTVLKLLVTRLGSDDYTAPRFIECCNDFKRGLDWTADSASRLLKF
jgi:hypothetical protein